jgi:hypothetical protein
LRKFRLAAHPKLAARSSRPMPRFLHGGPDRLQIEDSFCVDGSI